MASRPSKACRLKAPPSRFVAGRVRYPHNVDARHHESARTVRSQLAQKQASPPAFRAALEAVAPADRDAWLDLVFGLDEIPADDASLPRGCVPYVPSPIDKLIQIAEHADVQASDVFVDIGSGVGRATALMHLMTGAAAIGLEIQPPLVEASRELSTRVGGGRVSVVEGDAAITTGRIMSGSVFFLYCPFSGDRLARVLAEVESIARTRPIRVCCLDLPLPACPWLALSSQPSEGLAIYRSNAAS
jgi:SAM-dependent methyltransferase